MYQNYLNTGLMSDLVYSPTVGEFFASAQSNNINHPIPTTATNNAWWNWVPFPYVIAESVWRGLLSDLLRHEGQYAKAQAEEQAAMAELQSAIQRNTMTRYDQLTDQQTGVPRYQSMVGVGAS